MTLTKTTPAAELSVGEQRQLLQYEKIIAQGFDTFRRVAEALMLIREGRLYRAQYASWDEYLLVRWKITRQRAQQILVAAEIANRIAPPAEQGSDGKMSTIVDIVAPANEAQVRPLVNILPDQQDAAWQRAVATAPAGKVTAAHVTKTVAAMPGISRCDRCHKPTKPENLHGGLGPECHTKGDKRHSSSRLPTGPKPASTLPHGEGAGGEVLAAVPANRLLEDLVAAALDCKPLRFTGGTVTIFTEKYDCLQMAAKTARSQFTILSGA